MRLRDVAGRLNSLSPLAVLARGYAVCWNSDHTRIVREAAAVSPGETVHVTLERGELACEVKDRTTDPQPQATGPESERSSPGV